MCIYGIPVGLIREGRERDISRLIFYNRSEIYISVIPTIF